METVFSAPVRIGPEEGRGTEQNSIKRAPAL